MKKFIKSYYPVLFTSMYFFALTFSMLAAMSESSNTSMNSSNEIFIAGLFLAITFISVIAIFAMMISYMIHAAKSLKGSDIATWIVLIWFANVFIIPYYNFKFIQKRNDMATIVTSHIMFTILSVIFGIIFIGIFI